jgi:quinol monooxygenase YgiN
MFIEGTGPMVKLHQPYTVGKWVTKVGSEKAFIAEWESFAQWTSRNQGGAGTGCLLQDQEKPQQFISFGPWENVESINAWRERPEFKEFVAKVRGLLEEFQPQTLLIVASSEQ